MSGAHAIRIGGPRLAHRGTADPGPGGATDCAPGPEEVSEGGDGMVASGGAAPGGGG